MIATDNAAASENGKQDAGQTVADASDASNSAEAATDMNCAVSHSDIAPEIVEKRGKTDLAEQEIVEEAETKQLLVDAAAVQNSDASANERLVKMSGDISTLPLTNTEKDALKEPLPGTKYFFIVMA